MLTKKSRIDSVLKASTIGATIKGVTNFELNKLKHVTVDDYPELPNIRLGKQIERIFAFLIESSSNYSILKENIQVVDDKITIGELDFIIKNNDTNVISHLEIVYKFYLYDPNFSDTELGRWIGPNRKDSFIEKFTKLKSKQFPLLYKPKTAIILNDLDIKSVGQKLCFMASLFVPHSLMNINIPEINNSAIVGYWLTLDNFNNQSQSSYEYYLPQKQEWGITPQNNTEWYSFSEIRLLIIDSLNREFSPLCWIKKSDSTFEQCFIVWW